MAVNKDLLHKLQKAYQVLDEIMPYVRESTRNYNEMNEKKSDAGFAGRSMKWPAIIDGVATTLILAQILEWIHVRNESNQSMLAIICLILGCAVGFFIYFYVGKKLHKATYSGNEKAWLDNYNQMFDQIKENIAYLNFLPPEYWYPMAINYMIGLVESGRAETLNEVLDRTDQQVNRWLMDAGTKNEIEYQQDMARGLESITADIRTAPAQN